MTRHSPRPLLLSLALTLGAAASLAQTPAELGGLRQLMQQQRFAQARPGLQALLAQTHPDAATRLLIQDWLIAVDDLAELERRVQARLARQPEAVDHLGAGRLALERKQFDVALRHFQQARELAPEADTRARAWRGLAGVAYQQRDYALSLRQLEAARDQAPSAAERPDLLMAFNETLIRLGRTNEAVSAAEEAVRLNPDHELANYQLGNGYTRINYSELAQRCGEGFAQAATLTRRASDAFEQQALAQAREAAHAALAACPGYGRAHAVLAKVGEAQRMAVDVHREADEGRFAATPMPEIPEIERYVINWAQLSPRHRKRVALSIAPWKAYVPVLVAGGATHYIKPLYMRLSETPGAKALRDARIDYDSRLWDDVRGMGGHMTVTGIEDVERSIFQRYNTVLHELSHQVHGVLPAALQREIQDLYQQAKTRDAQSGQAFMSRYAGGSIWEYFAEGANGQDSPRRDAHDFREIVRERLVEKDPALQALVLRLFAQQDVSASLPLALVNGAHQHLEAGELPPALAQLTRAARLAPHDEQVLIAQLYALSLQGQRQPVEAAARRALARHPDSGSLRAAVVSARWHAGQALAPQLAGLAQGRERLGARDRFEVDMALGRYRLTLGQTEAALTDFEQALAYQADNPEALWGRASALAQAQRWAEAFEVYGRVLQLRTGLMPLRLDYARQLLIAGRLEQAQAQLNETRTLNPTEPELLALQAWLALAQQQPSQALALSAQALQAAPWCDTARLVQAAAWRMQGDAQQRQQAQAQLDELQARLRPGATPRQVYRADVSGWTTVNLASASWERSRAAVLALR